MIDICVSVPSACAFPAWAMPTTKVGYPRIVWVVTAAALRHYASFAYQRSVLDDVAMISTQAAASITMLAVLQLLFHPNAPLPRIPLFLVMVWSPSLFMRLAVFRQLAGREQPADEVLLVATQDSVALFGARRMLASLPFGETTHRCRVVINRVARGQITVGDVERALRVAPFAGIRFDPAVKRVQARGELLGARARGAGRDVRSLARKLVSAAEAVDGGR